jgi:CubicO group peptidase (beta-lactamase class C family)
MPDDDGMDMPPYGSVQDLTASIDAYTKGFGSRYGAAYAPSGVLVVAHEGKPIVTRAYGKTKLPDGAAPTASTRFRLGSITKPIVATLALKLAEDKVWSLDDSIKKWVPELPDAYQGTTLRALLSQTSGVPSYTDPGGLMDRRMEEVPQKDVIAWLAKHPPAAQEGGAARPFTYSNSNYYLLGVAIERATKGTLEQALGKYVFTPAGMKATGPQPGPSDAIGYKRTVRDELVAADVVANALPFGAGYLRSTAEDLIALDRALASGPLLTDASKTKMWTAVGKDYGLGWVVGDIGGSKIEWHNGVIDGFSSFFGRAPEQKIAVAFVGNVADFDGTKLGLDVLKMAMTGSSVAAPVERESVAIDDAFGGRIAGEYVLDKKAKKDLEKQLPAPVLASIEGMTLTYDKGSLVAKPSGQSEFGLKRAPEGTLFHPTLRVELELGKGDAAKLPGFTLKQGPITAAYVRGKAPAAKPKPKK